MRYTGTWPLNSGGASEASKTGDVSGASKTGGGKRGRLNRRQAGQAKPGVRAGKLNRGKWGSKRGKQDRRREAHF